MTYCAFGPSLLEYGFSGHALPRWFSPVRYGRLLSLLLWVCSVTWLFLVLLMICVHCTGCSQLWRSRLAAFVLVDKGKIWFPVLLCPCSYYNFSRSLFLVSAWLNGFVSSGSPRQLTCKCHGFPTFHISFLVLTRLLVLQTPL